MLPRYPFANHRSFLPIGPEIGNYKESSIFPLGSNWWSMRGYCNSYSSDAEFVPTYLKLTKVSGLSCAIFQMLPNLVKVDVQCWNKIYGKKSCDLLMNYIFLMEHLTDKLSQ